MKYILKMITLGCVLTSSAAYSATSERWALGGQFATFQPVIDQANQSGELFRIVGHCQSACTMFLGIQKVCVERSASLLFHAGHDRNRVVSEKWTDYMMRNYNAKLRQYLNSGHYMDTLEFHTISGAAMIDKFGYKECPRA